LEKKKNCTNRTGISQEAQKEKERGENLVDQDDFLFFCCSL
jgi:hypothetical protein